MSPFISPQIIVIDSRNPMSKKKNLKLVIAFFISIIIIKSITVVSGFVENE